MKRKEAPAWDYFDINPEVERLATCKICKKDISRDREGKGKKDFSTKGLNKHLGIYHPIKWKEVIKSRDELAAKKIQLAEAAAKSTEVYQVATTSNAGSDTTPTTVQQTLVQSLNTAKQNKWPSGFERQLDIQHKLLVWICDAMQPYSVVSNAHFRDFVVGTVLFDTYLYCCIVCH